MAFFPHSILRRSCLTAMEIVAGQAHREGHRTPGATGRWCAEAAAGHWYVEFFEIHLTVQLQVWTLSTEDLSEATDDVLFVICWQAADQGSVERRCLSTGITGSEWIYPNL